MTKMIWYPGCLCMYIYIFIFIHDTFFIYTKFYTYLNIDTVLI